MRWLKLIGLIVVVLVAALLVAPFLIPKTTTLRFVTGAIESRTPLKITLEDARLAFLPRPSVSLQGVDVKITVHSQQETLPLFSAASVSVRSHWNLIWAQRPALDVSMQKADVHLLATGPERFNYSPLTDLATTPEKKAAQHHTWVRTAWAAETRAPEASSGGITLERLEIRDSRLHYQAWKEAKQTYPVESLTVEDFKQDAKQTAFHTEMKGTLDELQYDLDFDTTLSKNDETSTPWQQIAVTSKGSSLIKPQTLAIKNQPLEIRSLFREANKKMEFKDGRLLIGQQAITFNGVRQESGALDLKLKLDPVQLAYLKTILPPLTGLPPIKDPNVSLRYQDSGKAKSQATISGQLKASEIKLPDYTLANVSGDILYREPKLELKNLKGQTLDGNFTGNANVDLSAAKPQYHFDLSLQNIAIEKIGSVGNLLTGRGDLKVDAKGQGFEEMDWTRNLDGDGDINLRELKLKQLQPFAAFFASPAWQVIAKLPGVVDSKALQAAQKLDGQARNLASHFRIEGGILHIPDIKLKFPQAAADFSGGIGLDKSLNFNGTLSLDQKLVASLIKDEHLRQALLSGGNSLDIPTKISGTVSKPLIRPDEAVMQQRVQTYLTRSVQQEATQTLQDKLLQPKEPASETKKKEAAKPSQATPPQLKDIQDLLKKPPSSD